MKILSRLISIIFLLFCIGCMTRQSGPAVLENNLKTKKDVIKTLGAPSTVVREPGREIFIYSPDKFTGSHGGVKYSIITIVDIGNYKSNSSIMFFAFNETGNVISCQNTIPSYPEWDINPFDNHYSSVLLHFKPWMSRYTEIARILSQ